VRRAKAAGYEVVAGHTPLRQYLYYRYNFGFSPAQLGVLVAALDRTRDVPGQVVEIGCAYGHTTVFLKTHMSDVGIDKDYTCIDTFAGFTPEDASYEERVRGKGGARYDLRYADVSLRTFERTIENAGLNRVRALQADVNEFDFSALGPIALCIVDVDLYRPVKRSLAEVYDRVSSGGVIVVDDCTDNTVWDGALQAYGEFVNERGLPHQVAHGLGLIDR